jgi:hypothetical protein
MTPLPLAASFLLLGLLGAGPATATEIALRYYILSDALGGFRLLAASGIGSRVDPIIVEEEILDAAPAILTIRRLRPERSPAGTPLELNIVKRIHNSSLRIWAGLEVELQEILREPSDYGDGLSFNQYAFGPGDADADLFGETRRSYEPFDRIRFEDGHVDPEGTVTIRLTITDPTPSAVFYLVQDPQLLSAGLDPPRATFAALRSGAVKPRASRGPFRGQR